MIKLVERKEVAKKTLLAAWNELVDCERDYNGFRLSSIFNGKRSYADEARLKELHEKVEAANKKYLEAEADYFNALDELPVVEGVI